MVAALEGASLETASAMWSQCRGYGPESGQALSPVEWWAMFSTAAVSLFVAFVVEVFVLVQATGLIGALPTALLVVLLSALGVTFLRLRTGGLVRSSIARFQHEGRVDAGDIADRSLVVAAGLLLVVPGFVTAALGLLLLIPPVRALVRPLLLTRFASLANLNVRFGRSFLDVDEVNADRTSTDPLSVRPELGSSRKDTK